MNELVRLRDGGTFLVRPMEVGDAPVVRAGYEALSPATLRARFFSPVPRLSPATLDDLVAVVPGRIVLLAFDARSGELAGGVRAVRFPDGRDAADVAVTVGDSYQRRGLGLALLRCLRRAAAAEGIGRLAGHVLVDNDAARRLIRAAGGRTAFDEPGVLRFEIPVDQPATVAA
jgi:RimJ/RimL family protein N-acetyltransferase